MLSANNAVISHHDGAPTLMIRFVNERYNVISNATAKLWILKNVVTAEGQRRAGDGRVRIDYGRFHDTFEV